MTQTSEKKAISKEKELLMDSQYSKNQAILDHLRKKFQTKEAIMIPLNTPSLKNNKEIQQIFTKNSVCHKAELYKEGGIWRCSKCHEPAQRLTRPILNSSKRVQEYREQITPNFLQVTPLWRAMAQGMSYPYYIGYYFIRDAHRSWDYINGAQIIMDLMTEFKWWDDDNILFAMPDFLGYHIAKTNPGCIITFMDEELLNLKKQYLNIKQNKIELNFQGNIENILPVEDI